MNHLRPGVWLPALLTALLIHAVIAVGLLWQNPVTGAAQPGRSGLQLGLAAPGSAPGNVAEVEGHIANAALRAPEMTGGDTGAIEAEAIIEPASPTPLVPQPVAEPAIAAPEPAPAIAATLPPLPSAEPVESPPLEVEAATAAAPPPLPLPRPVRTSPPIAEARPATSVPTAKAPAPPSPVASSAPASISEATVAVGHGNAKQAADPVTGGGGRTGAHSGTASGSESGTLTGGGSPGARQDYLTRLLDWLERYKDYPRRAQRRRQEGTAMLFFRMDRQGRVVEFRIAQGSGHDLLDAAVESMIRRAQPLPPMPDFMRQEQLELLVPVSFALR